MERNKKITCMPVLLVTVTTILSMGVAACSPPPPPQVYRNCLVRNTDRSRVPDSNKSDMRVYTSCGTFKVEDYRGRHNSADVFGAIEKGKTYHITAIGNRNTTWSEFPNIVDAEEVEVDTDNGD